VVEAFKARFNKHAHPAWYAAYALDPINAVYDFEPGMWRLQLLGVSREQERDAQALVARLAGTTQARAKEQWDSLMLKGSPESLAATLHTITSKTEGDGNQLDINAAMSKRRGFWSLMSTYKEDGVLQYSALAAAAQRLLSVHPTTCAAERVWSAWGRHYQPSRASLKAATAEKLIFIKTNSKEAHRGVDYALFLHTLAVTSDDEPGDAAAAAPAI
jgi:hypothetical protein